MSRPLILLTNDDGYLAKGINSLIPMLKTLGNVVVVAPAEAQSGQSGAITVKEPLRVKLIKEEEGLKIFKCSGTPVDSVKIAMAQLLEQKPDIVVSGINHGTNSSVSVHYSGTMGAAIEGAIHGVQSVGLSLNNHSADADFTASVEVSQRIIRNIMSNPLPKGICLNVNFPDAKTIHGIRVCKQANGKWVEEFEKRTDPYGGDYYWLTGYFKDHEPESEDTDEWAVKNGYAAIVPCNVDVTAYAMLRDLEERAYV